jgi:glycosyltransferase involved in cell wall biosynthesis
MRRIYFISPTNVADHRHGGASICSLAYLQALAELFPRRLTLISPCSREEMPELPDGVDEVVELPPRSPITKGALLLAGIALDRLSPFVDRWIGQTDLRESVVFMNSSRGGRLARRLHRLGVPCITLFHNVEAEYFGASESGLMKALKVRAADLNDRLAFSFSAASVFLSQFDARLMRGRSVQLIPGASTVEEGFFSPRARQGDESLPSHPAAGAEVLLNCSLGLLQNRPGIMAFLESWQSLAHLPSMQQASLTLAGANPAPELIALAQSLPRVSVCANPSDAEMDSLFARCRVCVSTIDAGSGIKVRVAEALRRGRPVVATPHSCLGYERIDSRVLRCSRIRDMDRALEEVLEWPIPGELESIARHEFEHKLCFEVGRGWLGELLQRVSHRPTR